MTANPKVSIVIPVYNGADYLAEAIDSALAQTYANCEVIVVNDGSADGGATRRVAQSYGGRIRYFEKANGGVSTALNLGIERMTGDYFSWLSHDDVYKPGKVEDQVGRLTSGDGLEVVYSGYDVIDSDGRRIGRMDPRPLVPQAKDTDALFVLFQAVLNGCAMLIPRRLLERFGPFDPALKSTQDYALWFEIFRHPEVRLTCSPFRGVKSRQHPKQGTRSLSGHREACCDLWIGMMDGAGAAARKRLYGTECAFYRRIGENLAKISDYDRAVAYARAKADGLKEEVAERLRTAKVSVVIPFYNRVDCTCEALESVLSQTFANVEVILVDDGSTDDLTRLEGLVRSDARARMLHVAHGGAARARNAAVAVADGDYVAFLDSDDLWLPEKLAEQVRFMLENGYDFSCGDYWRVCGGVRERIPAGVSGNCFPEMARSCNVATPTVMVSRAVVKAGLLRFPEGIPFGEDVLAWLRIVHEHEVGCLDSPLVEVRVGAESCVSRPDRLIAGMLNIAQGELAEYAFDEILVPLCSLLEATAATARHEIRRRGLTAAPERPSGSELDGLCRSDRAVLRAWRAVKRGRVMRFLLKALKAGVKRRARDAQKGE